MLKGRVLSAKWRECEDILERCNWKSYWPVYLEVGLGLDIRGLICLYAGDVGGQESSKALVQSRPEDMVQAC